MKRNFQQFVGLKLLVVGFIARVFVFFFFLGGSNCAMMSCVVTVVLCFSCSEKALFRIFDVMPRTCMSSHAL